MIVENGKIYYTDPNFRSTPYSHLMMLKENGIDRAKEAMKSFLDPNYIPKLKGNDRYVSMTAIKNSYKWSGLSNESPKILAPNIKLVDNNDGKWDYGQITTLQPKLLITSNSSLKDSDRLLGSYMKTLEYDVSR